MIFLQDLEGLNHTILCFNEKNLLEKTLLSGFLPFGNN